MPPKRKYISLVGNSGLDLEFKNFSEKCPYCHITFSTQSGLTRHVNYGNCQYNFRKHQQRSIMPALSSTTPNQFKQQSYVIGNHSYDQIDMNNEQEGMYKILKILESCINNEQKI